MTQYFGDDWVNNETVGWGTRTLIHLAEHSPSRDKVAIMLCCSISRFWRSLDSVRRRPDDGQQDHGVVFQRDRTQEARSQRTNSFRSLYSLVTEVTSLYTLSPVAFLETVFTVSIFLWNFSPSELEWSFVKWLFLVWLSNLPTGKAFSVCAETLFPQFVCYGRRGK